MDSRFEKGKAMAENAAFKITENRAVRTATRVAVVPSVIYFLGFFGGVFPGTRESITADTLVALGSMLELVAEVELNKNNS